MADVRDLNLSDVRDTVTRLFRYGQVGRCVSSVTHDVNNYLGAIMAYAELVGLEEALSEDARRMLGEIVSAVRQASGLVNTLTDVARKERVDIRIISPSQLMTRTLDMRRYDLKIVHIHLDCQFDETVGALPVDLPKLQQALMALLTNAIESVEADDEKQIRLSIASEDDTVEFVFCDSGPAPADDVAAKMFDPFFTTKDNGHLGLGLTYAREVAVLHEGELVYEAQRGFVLRLPKGNSLSLPA